MSVERAVPGSPEWGELAAPHLARYLFAGEYAAGRRVLDAGTGSGYGVRMLRTAGASSVVGIDVDPEAVRSAREHFGGQGIEFLVDDCRQPRHVSGPFDLICSFENIEHLDRPEDFLAAAAGLLAPDGVLLVSTPDRAASPPEVGGRPRNPFHRHEWRREEFLHMLARYFSQVEMRAQVQSASLGSRIEAVAALRQGLTWSNPLAVFLWRKLRFFSRKARPWKKLEGLAAPSLADYPIVPLATASIYGTPCFHVGICRAPKKG